MTSSTMCVIHWSLNWEGLGNVHAGNNDTGSIQNIRPTEKKKIFFYYTCTTYGNFPAQLKQHSCENKINFFIIFTTFLWSYKLIWIFHNFIIKKMNTSHSSLIQNLLVTRSSEDHWRTSFFPHCWKSQIPWSCSYWKEGRYSENIFLGHILLMRPLAYGFFKFKILETQRKDYDAIKLLRGLGKRYRLKYIKIVVLGKTQISYPRFLQEILVKFHLAHTPVLQNRILQNYSVRNTLWPAEVIHFSNGQLL